MDHAGGKTSPSSEHNIYTPLDSSKNEIRILIVRPGPQYGRLRCSLRVVSLLSDRRLRYETISYVWGSPKLSGTIQLDHQIMAIPGNSERVLKRFRYGDRPRVLWIDAICINQGDIEERNSQVRLMARIYSASTGNLIWLGEDDGQTEQAIERMNLLITDLASATNDFHDLESTLFDTDGGVKDSTADVPSSTNWVPLKSFLSSEWFSRLWVFQEAAMAPRSLCFKGHHEVDLKNIIRSLAWLAWHQLDLGWFSDMPQSWPLALLLRLVGPGYAWDKHSNIACNPSQLYLTHLLYMMRTLNASDPRDHVFGILGILERLHGFVPETLLPDYFASSQKVFRRAVLHHFDSHQTLGFPIYIIQLDEEPSDNWPSWVPRFDRPMDPMIEPSFFTRQYNADGGVPKKIHIDEDDEDLLVLNGCIVWEAIATAIPRLNRVTLDGNIRFLRQVEDCFIEAKRSGTEQQNAVLDDVLAAGDLEMPATYQDNFDYLSLRYREFLQTRRNFPDNVLTREDPEDRALVDFERAYVHSCASRSFFTLSSGRIGIGPYFCKRGDILAILYGHPNPVVLRPHPDHPGEWRFIGEAYVEGIMNGEAIEQHRASGKPDDIIRLR